MSRFLRLKTKKRYCYCFFSICKLICSVTVGPIFSFKVCIESFQKAAIISNKSPLMLFLASESRYSGNCTKYHEFRITLICELNFLRNYRIGFLYQGLESEASIHVKHDSFEKSLLSSFQQNPHSRIVWCLLQKNGFNGCLKLFLFCNCRLNTFRYGLSLQLQLLTNYSFETMSIFFLASGCWKFKGSIEVLDIESFLYSIICLCVCQAGNLHRYLNQKLYNSWKNWVENCFLILAAMFWYFINSKKSSLFWFFSMFKLIMLGNHWLDLFPKRLKSKAVIL